MTVINFQHRDQDRSTAARPVRATTMAGPAEIGRDRAVVTSPEAPSARPDLPRPHAPPQRPATFLAHLVAMREQAPQTRERRRAEPEEAVRVYQAALARASVIHTEPVMSIFV